MKKLKFSLFGLAFVAALVLSFAFKTAGKTDGRKFTVYHYELTSTDFNDLKDPANWEAMSSPGDCDEDGTIPCAITYPGDNFGAYLNGLGSGPAIVQAADTRRYP